VARSVGWSRLLLHSLALAAVLTAGMLLTSGGVSFTSDEGAAIVQARLLERGHGWHYANPLPAVDPAGKAQPFPHGDIGPKGLAPYAKHPAYPLLLEASDRVFGTAGLYLLSIAGGVVAALIAALLARHIDDRCAIPVLWTTGVVSPLFFDSFVVLAHTFAAAAAGLAVLLAWSSLVGPRRRWCRLAGMAVSVAATMLLRSEGLFLGPALAVSAGVLALTHRVKAQVALWVAAVALAATAATRVLEAWTVSSILGSSVSLGGPGPSRGFLADRYEGFYRTWVQPAYSGQGRMAAVALAAIAATAAAVLVRSDGGRVAALVALVAAAAGYAVALAVGPAGAIPGLLPAFPVVAGGALLVRRPTLDAGGGLSILLVGVAGVASAGVLLTQYRIGGGVEWGGRYFAYLLPVAVPVLVVAVGRAAPRQVLAGALVVAALLPALSIQALRHSHQSTRRLIDSIDVVARHAPPGDPGLDHRPLVVSTERLLPQLAWNRFEAYRWLVPATAELVTYAPRLARAGVLRIVLVTGDPASQELALAPWYRRLPAVPGKAPGVAVEVLGRTSVP